MLDLYEELAAIVDALESHEQPYALCGGMAMAVHGFMRATVDIDLLVPADHATAIEDIVAGLGYVVKAHPMTFGGGAVRIRRVSKIDTRDGDTMSVDLLLVTDASIGAWEARERRMWRQGPMTIVSREGLISLKRLRSSKQDLADIERLETGE